MRFTKSFKLDIDQEAKIEKIIAEGLEKYKDINHIICECPYNMGLLCEHEIEEIEEEIERLV